MIWLWSTNVTRTGSLSNWKGLAYPFMAAGALQSIRLAAAGITGPLEVFEGNKGLKDAIAGPFTIDWRHEDLERVRHTITKRYNAEIHAQSAIEGILELFWLVPAIAMPFAASGWGRRMARTAPAATA